MSAKSEETAEAAEYGLGLTKMRRYGTELLKKDGVFYNRFRVDLLDRQWGPVVGFYDVADRTVYRSDQLRVRLMNWVTSRCALGARTMH